MSTRVPTCLLRQICYSTSYRLPSLERIVFPLPLPAVKQYVVPYSPGPGGGYRGPASPFEHNNRMMAIPISEVPDREGNLTADEYRFFEGVDFPTSQYARCRYCQAYCGTSDLRKQHLAAGPCKIHLLGIYRVMRKDSNCASCGKATGQFHHGVRLCSPRCRNRFRFSSNLPLFVEAMKEYDDSEEKKAL